jgi:hypothetical protein
MSRAAWFLALPIAAMANAATLQVDFSKPGSATIDLPGAADDAHLAEPPGYFAATEPAARIVRRITIENTGDSAIANPDIRINGRPLLPNDDPLATLGVSNAHDLLALFAAWRDRVIHATTGLDASRNPVALLDVFGAAYCGDDARALAAITVANDGEARFARLNGHSVAEHRTGASWALLDGDQNLFYLDWDNRTLVGEAEILADPLLALRTQVFGRQSAWDPAAAWQNASRFEFIDKSRKQKNFRLKNEPPKRNWQLLPGEKITINLTSTPEHALAASDDLRANSSLRAVICTIDFDAHRNVAAKISLPYPALSANGSEPIYEVESTTARIVCQAARAQIPPLQIGTNIIESKRAGSLRITFDCAAIDLKSTPAPTVRVDGNTLRIEAKAADRVWWQISTDANFHLVAPNLDRVSEYKPELSLSPIDETFLSNGKYFARAKTRHGGVWSDWSTPASFVVKKPEQPHVTGMEGADGDQMHIRWKPGGGEMLVFGSNRLDFLPEVYGGKEVVRMENGAILESRPNKNLLATIPSKDGEAYVPIRACYRLIARGGNSLSVPSQLARATKVPAKILQNRHEKMAGALSGRDTAVEMDMP